MSPIQQKNEISLEGNKDEFKILKLCFFLFIFGRFWQHLFWDLPLRSFFWDEALLSPFFELFSWSWSDYTATNSVDLWILSFQRGVAAFLLFSIFIFLKDGPAKLKQFCSSVLLLYFSFVFFLYFKEKWYQLPMILEFSLQWILLFWIAAFSFRKKISSHRWVLSLKIAAALTFMAHGVYALGILPRPGHFVDMTLSILSCSEEFAVYFLNLAGILDFIVAVLLFVPRFALPSALYMVFWGFITAFARLWANIEFESFFGGLHYWGFEFLVRSPHYLVPLILVKIEMAKNPYALTSLISNRREWSAEASRS